MFYPFKNETQSIVIGEQTVENHFDKVSFYGNPFQEDILIDQVGLIQAQQILNLSKDPQIKKICLSIIDYLHHVHDLPKMATAQSINITTGSNPFA